MLFYTTDFETKSSEQHLRSLDLKILNYLNMTMVIQKKKEFYISPLKSGDFRDDSGFILKYGSFSVPINVDTNFINFFKLPNEITFI